MSQEHWKTGKAADFVVSGKSDEDIKDIHLIDNLDKYGKLIQ